jgi:2-isopropylmalate synthase
MSTPPGADLGPAAPLATPAGDAFHVYDTTLRDGTQREGFSPSVTDKLRIARHLDELGVGFIEGGWPGANPKDAEFFRRARTELGLTTAVLTAFGATRKAGTRAAVDPQVQALLAAQTPVVTLVAKAHARHVELALRTELAENLAMIADTVSFLVREGRRVFVDAEHFFDGYTHDREYALAVLRTAAEAGADVTVLCDTNGGMLPQQLVEAVGEVAGATGIRLGIHCHDDTACAVANTLLAVDAGVTHVQGTANGYGERAGNADLFSVVAALEAKRGVPVLPEGRLRELVRVAHAIGEVANLMPDAHQPFVGSSAFTHKAGLHASALQIDPDLYQHLDPAVVGNDMKVLVSELAGRASVEMKGRELGVPVTRQQAAEVVEQVKQRESVGYTYEAAEASFELLLRAHVEGSEAEAPVFTLESWRVIDEYRAGGPGGDEVVSEATVKLTVAGDRVVAVGEGNGPVNALDRALRSALEKAYPSSATLELVDYKVRILEGRLGTGARTRVLVETTDGEQRWSTVGVHENVVAASFEALQDAYSYGLLRR